MQKIKFREEVPVNVGFTSFENSNRELVVDDHIIKGEAKKHNMESLFVAESEDGYRLYLTTSVRRKDFQSNIYGINTKPVGELIEKVDDLMSRYYEDGGCYVVGLTLMCDSKAVGFVKVLFSIYDYEEEELYTLSMKYNTTLREVSNIDYSDTEREVKVNEEKVSSSIGSLLEGIIKDLDKVPFYVGMAEYMLIGKNSEEEEAFEDCNHTFDSDFVITGISLINEKNGFNEKDGLAGGMSVCFIM